MEQQRALNALEPYIALSKSATSPGAAADLVVQATSAPNTYVFAELLQMPNIQSLKDSPEQASHLTLLEVFAWGSFADYTSTPDLPPLNDSQALKLRLLSLLPLLTSPPTSVASSENLTYAYLQHHLQLPHPLALEKLLTTALSSGLITGHLDPLYQRVAVTSVAPLRDIPPHSIHGLTSVLEDWEVRCDNTLSEIEVHVQGIRDNATMRVEKEATRKREFDGKVDAAEMEWDGGWSGRGAKGKGTMDIRSLMGGVRNGKRSAGDMGNGMGGEGAMEVDEGSGIRRSGRKVFARGR